MTSLVAIRCRDGVVIGADSSATFGDGVRLRTIEQYTEKKIEIIGGKYIVACAGYVGHAQRYCDAVQRVIGKGEFAGKTALEIARGLSAAGVDEFSKTIPAPHLRQLDISALVAYSAQNEPCLCELPGSMGL